MDKESCVTGGEKNWLLKNVHMDNNLDHGCSLQDFVDLCVTSNIDHLVQTCCTAWEVVAHVCENMDTPES